ncbi:MAG: hypothetical protein KQJ78_19230 [Deltaproteobacteria bacterium]|nr:hypothetical protein [Deltaproteobacteria bacterium]
MQTSATNPASPSERGRHFGPGSPEAAPGPGGGAQTGGAGAGGGSRLMLVEVLSEGPHCIPCEYAIATVEYVAEYYQGRIEFRVVETKKRADAQRYLALSRAAGKPLPVPGILIEGQLVFDYNPGPEELRSVLDRALADWEGKQ